MGTFDLGNLYPRSSSSTQERTNTRQGQGQAAQAPGNTNRADWNAPVIGSIAGGIGIGVPMLIALGFMAWYLFRQYD